MHPDEVKRAVGKGLLAFPVTISAPTRFRRYGLSRQYSGNLAHGPAALFVAGGTGEFFSLTLEECRRIVVAGPPSPPGGADHRWRRLPVPRWRSSSRGPPRRPAPTALVLPPYLVKAEQEGQFRHLDAICRATALAVIPYNRDNCLLAPETLARLAERHET